MRPLGQWRRGRYLIGWQGDGGWLAVTLNIRHTDRHLAFVGGCALALDCRGVKLGRAPQGFDLQPGAIGARGDVQRPFAHHNLSSVHRVHLVVFVLPR